MKYFKWPCILCALLLVFLGATSVQAVSYSGNLSASEGSLLAGGSWAEDASFEWTVSNGGSGPWTYAYSWSASKDLSHLVLEVSKGLAFNDLISNWSTGEINTKDPEGPQSFGYTSGLPDPTGSQKIYGIKWDLAEDTNAFNLTLTSPRNPMWGDIFAKGGVEPPNGKPSGPSISNDGIQRTFAFNAGFGVDPTAEIGDGNGFTGQETGWALVPNTSAPPSNGTPVVPEPSTMLLFGAGMLGLAFVGRRSFSKKSET